MPSSFERKLTEINEARALSINDYQVKIRSMYICAAVQGRNTPIYYGEAPKNSFSFFFTLLFFQISFPFTLPLYLSGHVCNIYLLLTFLYLPLYHSQIIKEFQNRGVSHALLPSSLAQI